MAVADFNGDGSPDIIDSVGSTIAGTNFDQLSVLLNDVSEISAESLPHRDSPVATAVSSSASGVKFRATNGNGVSSQ